MSRSYGVPLLPHLHLVFIAFLSHSSDSFKSEQCLGCELNIFAWAYQKHKHRNCFYVTSFFNAQSTMIISCQQMRMSLPSTKWNQLSPNSMSSIYSIKFKKSNQDATFWVLKCAKVQ